MKNIFRQKKDLMRISRLVDNEYTNDSETNSDLTVKIERWISGRLYGWNYLKE